MRALYSAGRSDEKAVELYKNLLSGKDRLEVGSNGETAETIKSENGGRVIRVASLGKDRNSRLHLGVVLGHEARRDGYKVGMIDNNGMLITQERNNLETQEGSKTRMEMAIAIDKDYKGFIGNGSRLSEEVKLYNKAKEIGNMKMFTDYIDRAYKSEEDYYFPKISNGGQYQNINNERLKNETLLNGPNEEEVKIYNEKILQASVDAYAVHKYGTMEISDAIRDELRKAILTDEGTAEYYKYKPISHETIASDGCKLIDAVYMVNSLTGKEVDVVAANRQLKEAGIYSENNLLLRDDFEKALNLLADGEYEFKRVFSKEGVTFEDLYEYTTSQNQYVAHLRILRENKNEGYHSEAFAGFVNERIKYDNGEITFTADGVKTANSWSGGYTGKTERSLEEIKWWDIYEATPTAKYFYNMADLYKRIGLNQ